MKPKLIAFVGICAFLCGCVTPQQRAPAFLSPDFNPQSVDNIALLPVLIAPGLSTDSTVTHWVHAQAAGVLKYQRKYPFTLLTNPSLVEPLTSLGSPEKLAAALPTFKPPISQRWVLVFCLLDADTATAFGPAYDPTGTVRPYIVSGAHALMAAFLIDTREGRVVWNDIKPAETSGSPGVWVDMTPTMKRMAIEMTVVITLRTLPRP